MNQEIKTFDAVVVGGGHAGLEAVNALCMDSTLSVCLLTKKDVPVGSTPCNPAVGGVGKGQLVREIDCMGGLIGKIADKSAIQFRTLNESKGYAVQSTRVQVDKNHYEKVALSFIEELQNLTIEYSSLEGIRHIDNEFILNVSSNKIIKTKKLILTVGTFLAGKLHTGSSQTSGGRVDCDPSLSFSEINSKVKILKKKFKTGTPPRLDKNTIDFSVMDVQPSDPRSNSFHLLHGLNERFIDQVDCYKSHTTKDTIEIILDSKEQSPMFNGQIQGVGPRYCPSIEDKAFRYPDRFEHHIFIEPESLDGDSIYPNGISTSLPREIQEKLLKTVPGLEDAAILVPGYAVEYEVVDTSYLNHSLEYESIPGLYFAGQVNGTSGYEEAAGQGLVAGINCLRSLQGRSEIFFSRENSYLGVLVDDIISNKREEPYRLFTARAENRLSVREDNVIDRLGELRLTLGFRTALDSFIEEYLSQREVLTKLIRAYKPIKEGKRSDFTLGQMIRSTNLDPIAMISEELKLSGVSFDPRVIASVVINEKYQGYIKRDLNEMNNLDKLNSKKIDVEKILSKSSISNECKEIIKQSNPKSFFHLRRLKGLRAATVSSIASEL